MEVLNKVKKLLYMSEGDTENLLNFSGTPYYLRNAIRNEASKYGFLFHEIKTEYIINIEDIWKLAKQVIENDHNVSCDTYVTGIYSDFYPNFEIINKIKNSNTYIDVLAAVKHYDKCVKEHVNKIIKDIYQEGDCILLLNPYIPHFSIDVKYFLYLDTSLYEFYFLRKNGFLSFIKDKQILNYYYLFEKKSIENAEGIFTFSNACKEQLKKHYTIPKTHVVYAGVNFESNNIEIKKRNNEAEIRFLFIGRDFELKGGNLVYNAFQKLKLKNSELTIVTNDSVAKTLQGNKRIHIYGIQNKETIKNLYMNHQVLVFPTRIDAFGLVCCEAMLFGLLVIGSNYFAVPEILGTNNSEFIIKNNCQEDIETVMLNVYNNYSNYLELIEENKRRAKFLFNWHTVSIKILEIMSGLKL